MTDSPEFRSADELPRRLAGEIELPEPVEPLYFENREAVLTRVHDGLQRYEWPDQQESPPENFRWMQPAEDI